MGIVKRLVHGIDTVSKWTGYIVSPFCLFIMLILVYEIISRYGFNEPTQWAHETSAFLFGGYIILGGAYAYHTGAFIYVEVLHKRLPLRVGTIVNLFFFVLIIIIAYALLKYSIPIAWKAIRTLETSPSYFAPYIFPLKATLPLGVCLLVLANLARFIRDLHLVVTGKEFR